MTILRFLTKNKIKKSKMGKLSVQKRKSVVLFLALLYLDNFAFEQNKVENF